MKANSILFIVRMILNNEDVKNFLITASKKTDNQIDDFMIEALYDVLGD